MASISFTSTVPNAGSTSTRTTWAAKAKRMCGTPIGRCWGRNLKRILELSFGLALNRLAHIRAPAGEFRRRHPLSGGCNHHAAFIPQTLLRLAKQSRRLLQQGLLQPIRSSQQGIPHQVGHARNHTSPRHWGSSTYPADR